MCKCLLNFSTKKKSFFFKIINLSVFFILYFFFEVVASSYGGPVGILQELESGSLSANSPRDSWQCDHRPVALPVYNEACNTYPAGLKWGLDEIIGVKHQVWPHTWEALKQYKPAAAKRISPGIKVNSNKRKKDTTSGIAFKRLYTHRLTSR